MHRTVLSFVPLRSIALVVASLVAGSHALAQTSPMPRPAPAERGTPSTRTETPAADATADGSFNATQRAHVAKVSNYLSSVPTLVGTFVQVAPNGRKETGEFFVQKPGKFRFAYDLPSPTEYIISDGKSVVVRERQLAKQDVIPLSATPLRYLLSDRIDLLKDTKVVAVSADDVFITVTIEETDRLIGTQKLMLMIGAKDNQLKQWTVTDPQGNDVTVALYNLDTQKKPDPDLFKIDYMKYEEGGRGG